MEQVWIEGDFHVLNAGSSTGCHLPLIIIVQWPDPLAPMTFMMLHIVIK